MKKLLLLLLSFTILSSATAYASVSELTSENGTADKTVIDKSTAYDFETEMTKHDRVQKNEILLGEGASNNAHYETREENLLPNESDNTIALMSDEASGTCGTNLTWELDDEGTFTISGTGEMCSFKYNIINPPWYDLRQYIKKIVISSGITSIGGSVFYGCINLAEIDIPEGVISIGEDAFHGCINLTEIDIPEGVISIGKDAFDNCGLTSVSIPSTVKSISSSAFYSCDKLEEVHIADLTAWCNISFLDRLSNPLSYAGNLYLGNQLITELTIPSEITKIKDYTFLGGECFTKVDLHNNITSIGSETFGYCANLTNIEIPSSVTSIGGGSSYGAFEYCTGLTGVYITDLAAYCNISFSGRNPLSYAQNLYINNELATDIVIPNGITNIGAYAFEGCQSVESITIPSTVMSIEKRAFSECNKLLRINIPNSVTSIGDYAFLGCGDLQSINIPAKVADIGDDVFFDCTNLEAINVASGNSAYSSQNGVLFNKNKTDLILCPIGKIGEYAIPDGVANICDYAFYYSNLTEIKIPDSVTNIDEWAFGYCTKLSDIDIPSGVTSIGYASFNHCINLSNVELHNGLTSIGDFAFEYCISLRDIDIPNSVTYMGMPVFSNCESLTSVVLGTGITAIPARTFEYCSSLNNVDIRGDVTAIDSYAFRYCTELKEFCIPVGVTKINNNTFQGCTSLSNIEISTNITSIGVCAFLECDSLKEVFIPASVTSIGSSAFESCGNMIRIEVDSANDNYCSQDGVLYNKDKTILITCPEGKTGEFTLPSTVVTIEDSFGTNLTAINVESGNTVYSSEDGVLYDIDKTVLVRYPGKMTGEYVVPETIAEISSGALASSGITSITFTNPDNIINGLGGSTLRGCSELIDINIINSEEYSSENGVLFSNDKTTLISYPAGRTGEYSVPDGVETIDYWAFAYSNKLTGINIPDSVTYLGYYAFAWCKGLTSIDLPDSITSIGGYVFCGCRNLVDIKISSGLTTINMDAFQQVGAETIVVPEGVEAIELGAFSFCDNLKNIVLPLSVTYVGDWAFQQDTSLSDIYYEGTKEQWNKITIVNISNEFFTHATVHYNATGINPPEIIGEPEVYVTDDVYTIDVQLQNVEYDSNIIAVTYDNGAATGFDMDTISAGDTEKNISVNADSANFVKVFIWDSLNGMRPLCEAKTVEIQ